MHLKMASVGTMKFYYMSPDLIYGSELETRPNCMCVCVCVCVCARACVHACVCACLRACVCGHARTIMSEQNITL